MGKSISHHFVKAAFALVISFVFACAFAVLPGSAYAAGLAAGSFEVVAEMTAPTVSDVTSTGAGKLAVTVSGAYSGGEGYEYQVSLDSAFTNPKAELVASTTVSSSKTFTGLKPGKKYYVRVRQYGQANGKMYSTNWSGVKSAKVGIKPAKSKFVGTWKLVKSSKASENNVIKHNKKYFPKAKHTMTFTKKGVAKEKGYTGKKSTAKWVALSKTKGYLLINGVKYGSIKIKKSKLILKGSGSTWTLTRVK